MSELSEFEEMYLKRIYGALLAQPDEIVKTSQLAELMEVSAASTTEMIQRLSSRGYVTYIPYKGSRLTSEGFHHASRLKRREELLKILLRDVIGFTGDVDEIACRLEHGVDEELEVAIDRMLGFPEHTESGERIPLVEREMPTSLSNALLPVQALPIDSIGVVEMIVCDGVERRTIEDSGVKIGVSIHNKDGILYFGDSSFELSDKLGFRILVRVQGD